MFVIVRLFVISIPLCSWAPCWCHLEVAKVTALSETASPTISSSTTRSATSGRPWNFPGCPPTPVDTATPPWWTPGGRGLWCLGGSLGPCARTCCVCPWGTAAGGVARRTVSTAPLRCARGEGQGSVCPSAKWGVRIQMYHSVVLLVRFSKSLWIQHCDSLFFCRCL